MRLSYVLGLFRKLPLGIKVLPGHGNIDDGNNEEALESVFCWPKFNWFLNTDWLGNSIFDLYSVLVIILLIAIELIFF
jgi:hypothetical protein